MDVGTDWAGFTVQKETFQPIVCVRVVSFAIVGETGNTHVFIALVHHFACVF